MTAKKTKKAKVLAIPNHPQRTIMPLRDGPYAMQEILSWARLITKSCRLYLKGHEVGLTVDELKVLTQSLNKFEKHPFTERNKFNGILQ